MICKKSQIFLSIFVIMILMLMFLLIIFFFAKMTFFFVKMTYIEKSEPCIKYESVCQQTYTTYLYSGNGVRIPIINYMDVDCSQYHDLVVNRCIERKNKFVK